MAKIVVKWMKCHSGWIKTYVFSLSYFSQNFQVTPPTWLSNRFQTFDRIVYICIKLKDKVLGLTCPVNDTFLSVQICSKIVGMHTHFLVNRQRFGMLG